MSIGELRHTGLFRTTVDSVNVCRNLLLLPFAPFFVLACHACVSKSSYDLQNLYAFIESLQTADISSDDLTFFIELCWSFYNAALASIAESESS